jgi:glycosidase
MDKYNAKPSENPDYKINRPDQLTRKEQMLLLIHQYTFPGAPQIWNGEEVGMWGADDPDCRKPMIWDDLVYEDERADFDPSKTRPVDVVKPDTALLSFYKKLGTIRKENPVLVYGDLSFTVVDNEKMVLAYNRRMGNNEIIAIFNRSNDKVIVNVRTGFNGYYGDILSAGNKSFKSINNLIEINIQPMSAVVLKKK